MDPTTQVLSGQ